MRAGEKMNTSDGLHQVCLFPLEVMHITQTSNPESFSHCCGHPTDYVGTTPKYPIYAPCDMTLIEVGTPSNGNVRTWQSNKEVMTPNGLSYVCIQFVHEDNPQYNTIGDMISQGDLISHTGTAGFVTGDHTHIDQAFGVGKKLIDYGIVCSSGNECYALQDSTYPYDVFYSNDTEIIETMGYIFQEYKGGVVPSTKNKFKFIYYLRRHENEQW